MQQKSSQMRQSQVSRGWAVPLASENLAMAAQYHTDFGMLFAGLVLVTLPILIVYVLLQQHIVRGVTAGALKG